MDMWTRRAVVGGLAATVVPLRAKAEALKPAAGTPADGFTILEAGEGKLRLLPAPADETAVWAYNGKVPGPLIRVRQGDPVKVRLVNKLAQPTTLCWHGVRNLNAMDGVGGLTQKPVPPGESFDYAFTPPDAGLFWYHPHVFPQGAEQIGRGLYGLLVVDEPEPPPVDQDLILVLDDWSLDAKGQIASGFLDKAVAAGDGRFGQTLTVNSAVVPGAKVEVRPGGRVRLRILNACSARIAILNFAGMEALVVAIDGQPSEVFPPASGTFPIGPGARFELIVDMPIEAGKAPAILLRGAFGPDTPLLQFATKGAPIAARPRTTGLPRNARLPERIPLEKSIKRDLAIEVAKPGAPWLWTLGGAGSDGFSSKPLFRVKHGGAVTLAFVNKTAFAQSMHVHGHVFRILHDLDDGWDPYWRESILLAPGRTKHVAFIADNPGKWAVESLILDRQMTGLAGWFEVV